MRVIVRGIRTVLCMMYGEGAKVLVDYLSGCSFEQLAIDAKKSIQHYWGNFY